MNSMATKKILEVGKLDVQEDALGIGGVGGFVDTVGTTKRKRRGRSESSEGELPDSQGGTITRDAMKDEVEERLEEILFGKKPFYSVPSASDTCDAEPEEEDSDDEGSKQERSGPSSRTLTLERQPAWEDEDDAGISVDITAHSRTKKLRVTAEETTISGVTYSKRLRSQYEKLRGQPEWARAPLKRHRSGSGDDSDSSDEETGILQRAGDLLTKSTDHLPKGILDLKKVKDANGAKRAAAMVRALEFHPSASVVLVGGYNKTLDLFEVDGHTNPKIQSVHIQGFPISHARFTQDGKEVVLTGRKRRFFVYDMMAGKITAIRGIRGREERYWDKFVVSPDNQYIAFLGKDGYIVLVSNRTKQWIDEVKMNGNVFDVAFTSDSRYMLSTGSEGRVYVWDMSRRECVNRFVDEGCIRGTTIAVSPNDEYVACGSNSGVVNLYTGTQCLDSAQSSTPKPIKPLMNLVTGIDALSINHTSELMVMASKRKKDALRVVHLPSQTVFSNWPVTKTPLNYVSAVAVSPLSRYLAVGNARGRVLLYRLNHYCQ